MMCHKFESMNGYMNDASDIIARRTLKLGRITVINLTILFVGKRNVFVFVA